MSHKAPDTERTAECSRMVDEITNSGDTLTAYELWFIRDISSRIEEFGERCRLSDSDYHKLMEIYHRVV
jgi:hypothetical protein